MCYFQDAVLVFYCWITCFHKFSVLTQHFYYVTISVGQGSRHGLLSWVLCSGFDEAVTKVLIRTAFSYLTQGLLLSSPKILARSASSQWYDWSPQLPDAVSPVRSSWRGSLILQGQRESTPLFRRGPVPLSAFHLISSGSPRWLPFWFTQNQPTTNLH